MRAKRVYEFLKTGNIKRGLEIGPESILHINVIRIINRDFDKIFDMGDPEIPEILKDGGTLIEFYNPNSTNYDIVRIPLDLLKKFYRNYSLLKYGRTFYEI